jgi:transposase
MMSNRRIEMRKIRQVLRLHHESALSSRKIASSLSISRDAVRDYLTRAAAAELLWPLPADMEDAALEQRLFPIVTMASPIRKPMPDWGIVHAEMQRKGATLQVLHQEYLSVHPDGVGYSQFCERYRGYLKTLKRHMRQTYLSGDRVFVDYAGKTMPIINRLTGDTRYAQVFVGVLGASKYIYAEAFWSQKLPDWIMAHVRMFEHFGGVPAVVVCDNLKSAVTRASRTDPEVNVTYQAMAEHYGTVILPARPKKPKDKSLAEGGVLIVTRWILFRLRNRVFGSLAELNEAIRELLIEVNNRPFQKLPGSRQRTFESIDLPALQRLPSMPYEYVEFRKVRVGHDGFFTIDACAYTAPAYLSGRQVELRVTANTIQVLYQGQSVASHLRSRDSTPVINPQHLEPAHRHFGMWDAAEALRWAEETGSHVHAFLQEIIAASSAREQGYLATNGLKKLAQTYGNDRLDAGCLRAVEIGAKTLTSVRSILKSRFDQHPHETREVIEPAFDHENIRGASYYH